ncbi:hypothetical protein [Oryzibacter oryziterrae]|uniref:hypothetical protein n=1 Tax=Oryzibacter oryziterrae TaxID=2766474 RepID=UPI001F1E4E5E|nr:hypothetical protein [Oryzibacter oryziterrae]
MMDDRPVETVLIIGNSRVFCNDMPDMIRPIADSAEAPVRYVVTSHAVGAATFETHWRSPEVHALLAQHWDHVILQAESAAQWYEQDNRKFHEFGRLLVNEDRLKGGSPIAINVGWVYGEENFNGDAQERRYYLSKIQSEHRLFGEENHVPLINTGHAWEMVHQADPRLALTTDGNHPTANGSYLSALMIYRYIAQAKAAPVRFAPDGVSQGDADEIRMAVDRFGG